MKNKLTLGLFTGVVATTGLVSIAYGAEDMQHGSRTQLSDELHTQLHEIILDGDYKEYVQFTEDNSIRAVDEDKFVGRSDRANKRAARQEAALDGDYDQWRSIVGDDKLIDIDEDNFYLIVNLTKAEESGSQDGIDVAKQALQEAGIERLHDRVRGKPSRGDRGGREGFPERFGIDRGDVDELSDDEKQDLLERIIIQIKKRLGLD